MKPKYIFIAACACVLIFAAGVIIGGKIGWSTRDQEAKTEIRELKNRVEYFRGEAEFWFNTVRRVADGESFAQNRDPLYFSQTRDLGMEPRGDDGD